MDKWQKLCLLQQKSSNVAPDLNDLPKHLSGLWIGQSVPDSCFLPDVPTVTFQWSMSILTDKKTNEVGLFGGGFLTNVPVDNLAIQDVNDSFLNSDTSFDSTSSSFYNSNIKRHERHEKNEKTNVKGKEMKMTEMLPTNQGDKNLNDNYEQEAFLSKDFLKPTKTRSEYTFQTDREHVEPVVSFYLRGKFGAFKDVTKEGETTERLQYHTVEFEKIYNSQHVDKDVRVKYRGKLLTGKETEDGQPVIFGRWYNCFEGSYGNFAARLEEK